MARACAGRACGWCTSARPACTTLPASRTTSRKVPRLAHPSLHTSTLYMPEEISGRTGSAGRVSRSDPAASTRYLRPRRHQHFAPAGAGVAGGSPAPAGRQGRGSHRTDARSERVRGGEIGPAAACPWPLQYHRWRHHSYLGHPGPPGRCVGRAAPHPEATPTLWRRWPACWKACSAAPPPPGTAPHGQRCAPADAGHDPRPDPARQRRGTRPWFIPIRG